MTVANRDGSVKHLARQPRHGADHEGVGSLVQRGDWLRSGRASDWQEGQYGKGKLEALTWPRLHPDPCDPRSVRRVTV